MKSSRTITSEEYAEFEKRRDVAFLKELEQEIQEKKRQQVKKAYEESGLKTLLDNKTFDNYHDKEPWQQRAKRLCKKYASSPDGKWLLVSGPTGCGKTHLCTAVVKTLFDQEIPVWYMLYREDINHLKPMQGVDAEEREQKLRRFKTAKALYIDDLYKGSASNAELSIMFDLIDYRYRNNLQTIISTEFDLDQLIATESAIAGRIVEKSKKVLINNDPDRNYRMKGYGEK